MWTTFVSIKDAKLKRQSLCLNCPKIGLFGGSVVFLLRYLGDLCHWHLEDLAHDLLSRCARHDLRIGSSIHTSGVSGGDLVLIKTSMSKSGSLDQSKEKQSDGLPQRVREKFDSFDSQLMETRTLHQEGDMKLDVNRE